MKTMPRLLLIAPSGAVTDTERLQRAEARLQTLGWQVELDASCFERHQRFAGHSTPSLCEMLHRVAERQDIDLVMAARGGYGLSRLLPYLNWTVLENSRALWCGHSDLTFLQNALLAKTGRISLHGPMGLFDFGHMEPDLFTEGVFDCALVGHFSPVELNRFNSTQLKQEDGVERVSGQLFGGNLSCMQALVGTDFWPKSGSILFLEDVSEHPYRIERMLLHLLSSGALKNVKAIIFGTFSDYRLNSLDAGYTLNDAIGALQEMVPNITIWTGLPFGHIPKKITLPLGATVHLEYTGSKGMLFFK
jgi:muramoyltetrapeptide carboxypeptidase